MCRQALISAVLSLLLCRCSCFQPVAEFDGDGDGPRGKHDAARADAGGTSGDGGGDAASKSDATTAFDAALQFDATVGADSGMSQQDAGCGGGWRYEARAIASIDLLDGVSRIGATDRLKVKLIETSACERPSRVDVAVSPGAATDLVELTAHAWVRDGACSKVAMEAVALVPGRQQGNLGVSVRDASGPAGVVFSYDRTACSGSSDCQCHEGTPPGTVEANHFCRTDCSCAGELSCVYEDGGQWTCALLCSDSTECGVRESCTGVIIDNGVTYAGLYCSSYMCDPSSGVDCPTEFQCVFGDCMDQRGTTRGEDCACDTDCAVGIHFCSTAMSAA